MKFLKIALVMFVLLINLTIAQSAWADRPKVSKNADYIELTKTLDRLQEQESNESTPELKQKIDELKLQKAAIASGTTWGQCRNETGNTLAIYGSAPGEESKSTNGTLYFLGDGETTPDGWDCNGVYLPSGINVSGIDSSAPSVFRIIDGTRLVAKLNSDTGEIAFNVPPLEDTRGSKSSIPNLSQTFINSRIPSTLSAEEIDD
jgi:hypothetical protein